MKEEIERRDTRKDTKKPDTEKKNKIGMLVKKLRLKILSPGPNQVE